MITPKEREQIKNEVLAELMQSEINIRCTVSPANPLIDVRNHYLHRDGRNQDGPFFEVFCPHDAFQAWDLVRNVVRFTASVRRIDMIPPQHHECIQCFADDLCELVCRYRKALMEDKS